MTFEQARKELNEISGGRYRSLYYNLTEHVGGKPTQKCSVYVDSGHRSEEHFTWEAALDDMRQLLNRDTECRPVIEGEPLDDEIVVGQ